MSLHKKRRKIHLSISFLSLTLCSIKTGIAFNKSLIQCPEKLQIGSCVTWSLIFSLHYVNLSSLLSYLFRLASFSSISQLYFSSGNHPWLIPPLFNKITIVPHPTLTPTYVSWADWMSSPQNYLWPHWCHFHQLSFILGFVWFDLVKVD